MKRFFLRIWALILLEFRIEYRNRYEIFGLLLLVIVVDYIWYRSIAQPDLIQFNALYWVLILVLSTNFALRSFAKTKAEESRYLYQLSDATSIIVSKLLFNWLLIGSGALLFLMAGLFFQTLQGFPFWSFLVLILVSSLALSGTFSLPSALVMTSSSKATLLGIMAFPVSIPVILVSIAVGSQLITQGRLSSDGIMILVSISMIMTSVSLLLFKYNWQSQ